MQYIWEFENRSVKLCFGALFVVYALYFSSFWIWSYEVSVGTLQLETPMTSSVVAISVKLSEPVNDTGPVDLINIHLASFASSDLSMEFFKMEAEKFGFQSINLFNESALIGTSFWNKHSSFILNHKKGFGYWIWKIVIILQMLENLPEDAPLLYVDAGCVLYSA